MVKRIYITAAITLIIALLAVLFFNFFEIFEYKDRIYPTREISRNSFYALEQWLNETGHPVRAENYFYSDRFSEIKEKVMLINSGVLYLGDAEKTTEWIERGNYLIIYIDHYSGNSEEELKEYLLNFGVTYEYVQASFSPAKIEDEQINEDLPDLYSRTAFNIKIDNEFFAIKDNSGIIRLVEIKIGDGALTVTGAPVFMQNLYLKNEKNAVLAWRLTGARDNGSGVVFVYPQYRQPSESMLETISKKGNLLPVFISAFLLIITGFWMVIPRFGLIFEEKQRVSRPISDRFLAEIQFLKKFNALNYYLSSYDLEQDSEKNEKYNYRDLINQYRRLNDGRKKF